jgi:hypothetical protein
MFSKKLDKFLVISKIQLQKIQKKIMFGLFLCLKLKLFELFEKH